jgi:hypothetical protein
MNIREDRVVRKWLLKWLINFFHDKDGQGKSFHITFSDNILLSLSPQPSLGLGLLLKMRLNFLEASQQFSFFTGWGCYPHAQPLTGPKLKKDIQTPAGSGIFLFTPVSRPALGSTQPPTQWVAGALSLGVK